MSRLQQCINQIRSRSDDMLPRHAYAMLGSIGKLQDMDLVVPTALNALAHRHCGMMMSGLASLLQSAKVGQGSNPEIVYYLTLGWIISSAEALPSDPIALSDPRVIAQVQGLLQAISQCRDLMEAASESDEAEA